MFEDTRVIKSRKSKKGTQYNGQKGTQYNGQKGTQYNGQKGTQYNGQNDNDLQNTTRKTKDWATRSTRVNSDTPEG